jgi:hypothetical protein
MQGLGSKRILTTLAGQRGGGGHIGKLNAGMGLDWSDIHVRESNNLPSQPYFLYTCKKPAWFTFIFVPKKFTGLLCAGLKLTTRGMYEYIVRLFLDKAWMKTF